MNDADRPTVQPGFGRARLLQVVIVALCVALSIEALASMARWRANRADLVQVARRVGGDESQALIRRVTYERTAHHAQLIAARALVYDAMSRGAGTSEQAEAARARLPQARELAREALRQQPNSWQASMFLGAAIYLEWSLAGDRRLYTAAARWEEPLAKAIREAPGNGEPRRFLATAYLETWPALSAGKKAYAAGLLAEVFRHDPEAFARLAPVWLATADDREQALELIPDRPEAWRLVESSYAAGNDWSSFCLARDRHLDALERKLEADLAEAAARLRLGDQRGSRSQCLQVVATAPRAARFADLVSRAFELYPPGLHGLRSTEVLEEWLGWALELDSLSLRPFSPRVLGRLTDAIGDLDPAPAAYAALIAGDVYRIQRYERLADSRRRREWAPFLIAKSRWLVERDELAPATRTLTEVHRSAEATVAYWLARQRVARAAGDLADLGESQTRLAELKKRQWGPLDWRWRGREATLEIYPDVDAAGVFELSIEINKTPAAGAVVEVVWDGSVAACQPVMAGETIELNLQVEPKPHRLELRALAGGETLPGSVRLSS